MSGRFGSYRTSYGTSYRRRGRGRGGLTGNQLKTLGGLFLLLDHIGAVVIQGGILHGRDREAFLAAAATDLGQRLLALSRILRYCGRLAFPIFAFLLTEGFIHTSDRVRYCIRLGVLAFMLWYRKRKHFEGEMLWVYFLGYGLGRLWIEGLRTDQLKLPGTPLAVSQLLSAVLVLAAAGVIIWRRRKSVTCM